MPQPISTPAGFAPVYAVGYSTDGELSTVSAASPLPVALAPSANTPQALAGTAAANTVAGPFAPLRGTAVTLSLSGSWNGTVAVLRSTDGGTTKLPLTAGGQPWARFSANCCEAVWEENDPQASLWLDMTLASGSVSYRLGH